MKGKGHLLPRMAAGNIRRNSGVYLPYVGVSIFALFTYFVFDLIRKNEAMYTLPKGGYAVVLINVGFSLLGVIMIPFLYYTNSFLIKQRKRELGIYSILGMEKKHIGIMMFWESLILYGIIAASAMALGLLFSRLLFLLLLNLARLPVDIAFTVSPQAVRNALSFYGFITFLNLFANLVQVGKAKPMELMREAKGGERQPKLIPLWSLAGLVALGAGYFLAMTIQFDRNIYTHFFMAVFLVVMGTYLLFTSGSIVFLQAMKRRKRLYYKAENFITVSGMLYRMKKNAAGLSNICIFSTMAIITVVCTVAVRLGMDSILDSSFEKTMEVAFLGKDPIDREALSTYIDRAAGENGVQISEYVDYSSVQIGVSLEQNIFYGEQQTNLLLTGNQAIIGIAMGRELVLVTLEEYNRLEGTEERLDNGEVLLYSEGKATGWDNVSFGDHNYTVKREIAHCNVREKTGSGDTTAYSYVVVAADEGQLAEIAACLGVDADGAWSYYCGFEPTGQEQALNAFSAAVYGYVSGLNGYAEYQDHRQRMEELESSYGGLIFVGVFFGLIFLICLLAAMYYKQITEGLEDRKNFEIMQKVGMDDNEIRNTIKKQVRTVFLLPLAGALLHTLVGMRVVKLMLVSIHFYETWLLIGSALGISLVFAIVYGICYKRTSQAYYRIVRQM